MGAGSTSAGAAGAAFGAIEGFFDPGRARAREELDRQHEMVVPAPSPGDRILEEGRIVIRLADSTGGGAVGETSSPRSDDA